MVDLCHNRAQRSERQRPPQCLAVARTPESDQRATRRSQKTAASTPTPTPLPVIVASKQVGAGEQRAPHASTTKGRRKPALFFSWKRSRHALVGVRTRFHPASMAHSAVATPGWTRTGGPDFLHVLRSYPSAVAPLGPRKLAELKGLRSE